MRKPNTVELAKALLPLSEIRDPKFVVNHINDEQFAYLILGILEVRRAGSLGNSENDYVEKISALIETAKHLL